MGPGPDEKHPSALADHPHLWSMFAIARCINKRHPSALKGQGGAGEHRKGRVLLVQGLCNLLTLAIGVFMYFVQLRIAKVNQETR